LTVAHAFHKGSPSPAILDAVEFQFDLEDPEERRDFDEEGLVEETSKGSQTLASKRSRNIVALGLKREEYKQLYIRSP